MIKPASSKTKTTEGRFKILIAIFIFLGQWQSFIFRQTYNLCVSCLESSPNICEAKDGYRVESLTAGSNPATNDYCESFDTSSHTHSLFGLFTFTFGGVGNKYEVKFNFFLPHMIIYTVSIHIVY